MKKIEDIFKHLNLDRSNGLYITSDGLWEKEISLPNRVKEILKKKEITPYAFFCLDNKPLLLFFQKPPNKKKLHKSIWNFNECPIVIIIEKDVVEIYNGFYLEKNSGLLKKIGGEEKLNDFIYFELVTGKTWEKYSDQLNYKNRVDYNLLENIKLARKLIVEKHGLDAQITNAIIGKSIFVRYLIDRNVKLNFDGKSRLWTNDEFCELLSYPNKAQKFFDYLEDKEKGFNGNLFPLSASEYKQITKEEFQVIVRLLQGDEIDTGQFSLFQLYDFSIIPIEFISNVYELFIGQDNQRRVGAYYTPLFLVDYILKETVGKKLTSKDSSYNCKVLDPACGSGIFLVETLRKIIEKYIDDTGAKPKSFKFKSAIKDLAKNNLYGIDKDLSAVQVAIFSIYLTLLDYLKPREIEDFKFPALLNTNFFAADFFDETLPFNTFLNNIDFDCIVGNPPWKGNGMDAIGKRYLKSRKNRENGLNKKYEVAINNNEIAEGFILRISDFCQENTQVSLIIRSSSLYNLGYNNEGSHFRRYWLEEYFIDKILELASVRHEVFEKSNEKAIAPAAILFYRYANGNITDNNIVEHITLKQSRFFSLFKIFTINRSDFKHVQQKKLKEFDWLWKVLVYGSYLDFNFIKRLKEDYKSIKQIISDKKKFVEGTGIQYSSKPTYKSKHLIGKPFVDSKGVTSFFIVPDKISKFEKLNVHRLRDERLFKAPMLLIREGLDMNALTAKCAISRKDVLFKDSITSIKIIHKNDMKILQNIAAVFNSSLFSYYAINIFASIGIERERAKNYNKYSFPYIDINANARIKNIENAYRDIYSEKKKTVVNSVKINELETFIQSEIHKIDDSIYTKLFVNEIESALIDYSLEINRNLIVGDEFNKNQILSKLNYEDVNLDKYASLFLKRFKSKLDTSDKKFTVEIWHTNQIVGMFFKMVAANKYKQEIIWRNKQDNSSFLSFLMNIGTEKITDKLFIQKDIRGFDNNGDEFFIIKPNEKRLWHKAIGYLDVNEFADAILKAGGKQNNVL